MLPVLLCLVLQDSIDDSIRALGDPDPVLRDLAVERLVRAGTAALDRLEPLANDPDPERRARIHQVLREIGSPVALVADLRSDRIAGNAEEARRKLLRTMEIDADRVTAHLLPLLDGRDPQAAFYAAWLLQRGGRGDRILEAQPGFHEWAVRAFYSPEVEPMMWVAGHVVLRLDASRPAGEVDAAYARGLAGVRPDAVIDPVRWYITLAGEIRVRDVDAQGLPAPLWQKLLDNWRDDTSGGNANRVDFIVNRLRATATPVAERLLDSDDLQQRQRAAMFLIDGEPTSPSPRLIEIAVECLRYGYGYGYGWGYVWDCDAPIRFLRGVGLPAVAPLDRFLEDDYRSPVARLNALNLRLAIDPAMPLERVDWVWRHLRSDNEWGNALLAAQALARIDGPLAPHLTPWMEDPDPQVAAAAYAILARRGEVTRPPQSVLDAIARFSRWSWRTADEDHVLKAALREMGDAFEPFARELEAGGYEHAVVNVGRARHHILDRCDCLEWTGEYRW